MSFAQRNRSSAKMWKLGLGPKSKASAAAKTAYFNPSQAEVLAAVRSLYADQLEPFGRILLRRVRERYAALLSQGSGVTCSADDAPLIDPKWLHRICRSCEGLHVHPVDGNEVSVLLIDRAAVFVDVCSPVDNYPPELWTAASAYFQNLASPDVLLPGGRYACAQALASRNLPFLDGRSLGEICHIVQLAVSRKKILGYIDGNMVPYRHSEESVKEECAVWQQPFVSATKQTDTSMPVASWDETRACLSAILRGAFCTDPGMITVSNVKRLFRSHFGLDLSETALGYSRLSELLQDARLSDICSVQIRGACQFVVRREMVAPAFPTYASASASRPLMPGQVPHYYAGSGFPRVPPGVMSGMPPAPHLHQGHVAAPPPSAQARSAQGWGSSPPPTWEPVLPKIDGAAAHKSDSLFDCDFRMPTAESRSLFSTSSKEEEMCISGLYQEADTHRPRHASAPVAPPPGLPLPIQKIWSESPEPDQHLLKDTNAEPAGAQLSSQLQRLFDLTETDQKATLEELSGGRDWKKKMGHSGPSGSTSTASLMSELPEFDLVGRTCVAWEDYERKESASEWLSKDAVVSTDAGEEKQVGEPRRTVNKVPQSCQRASVAA